MLNKLFNKNIVEENRKEKQEQIEEAMRWQISTLNSAIEDIKHFESLMLRDKPVDDQKTHTLEFSIDSLELNLQIYFDERGEAIFVENKL
jgi:hypothetical protein